MKKDKEKTKVIFRKAYNRYTKEWEVEAFLPEAKVNPGYVGCYAHVGQHSEAHYDYYRSTRPCTPKEYAALKREMENYFGYNFKVIKRITWRERNEAWKWASAKEDK